MSVAPPPTLNFDISELEKLIDSHPVVSFDVFDTLIVRPFDAPKTLFSTLERIAVESFGSQLRGFAKLREKARSLALEEFKPAPGEDIPMTELYAAIAAASKMPDEMARSLMEIEKRLELDLVRPRLFGKRLFRMARSKGKRIVLASDMYLDRDTILAMLDACGFPRGSFELFVSSSAGATKAGGLFIRIVEKLGCPPSSVVHFGDSFAADFEAPRKAGLDALPLPSPRDAYSQLMRSGAALSKAPGDAYSVIRGLIANEIADDPPSLIPGSHFNADFRKLGYALLGPCLLSFSKWLLEEAKRDGVEELLFLSREGWVMKRCYDALLAKAPDVKAPASKYLLASRMALYPALLKTPMDVLELQSSFYGLPCEVGKLLKNRFRLDKEIPEEVFIAAGFSSSRDVVRYEVEEMRAIGLVLLAVAPEILRISAERRALLEEYYRNEGLRSGGGPRKAYVDIGYRGSVQVGLAKLLDVKLDSYFLSLSDKAEETLSPFQMKAKGFFPSLLPQCFMFETLLINEKGGFDGVARGADSSLSPLFLSLEEEAKRKAISVQAQEGAVKFVEDAAAALSACGFETPSDSKWAFASVFDFIFNPHPREAALFEDVDLENTFVSAKPLRLVSRSEESLWPQGRKALDALLARSPSSSVSS